MSWPSYNDDNILDRIKKGYSASEIATAISSQADHYSEFDGLLYYKDLVMVPDIKDIRRDIILTYHTDINGSGKHLNIGDTITAVNRLYYWQGLRRSVRSFVSFCDICNQVPPPSKEPWSSVWMTQIQRIGYSNEFGSILIIEDRCTGHVRLGATGLDDSPEQVIDTLHSMILCDHRLPDNVVTNLGNGFMKEALEGVGIKQYDDFSVPVKCSFAISYLREFTGYLGTDWSKYLRLAEFTYNDAILNNINGALNEGQEQKSYKVLRSLPPIPYSSRARKYLAMLRQIQHHLQIIIQSCQELHATNRSQADADYYVPRFLQGDLVWLNWGYSSGSTRRLGPFEIEQETSFSFFEIELPEDIGIHPIFHVSLLEEVDESADILPNADFFQNSDGSDDETNNTDPDNWGEFYGDEWEMAWVK